MKRRSRAGGEPLKTRRRKTVALKLRNAPKAVRRHSSSAAGQETEVARLTRELNEALQQQNATGDVLKVISRSTFDLQTVLTTLLESAARLSEADKGIILRPTGKDARYYVAASCRHTPEYEEHQKHLTFAPGRSGVVGRVLLEGKSVQIPDVLADPEYIFREIARLGDFRTILGVPLLREGGAIGVLVLQRAAVRPFSEKQIQLVETFADQAVIAIENVRLFNETKEALERQTATADILKMMASSPADVQPVFEAIVNSAASLFEPCAATITILKDDKLHWSATAALLPGFDVQHARAIYPFHSIRNVHPRRVRFWNVGSSRFRTSRIRTHPSLRVMPRPPVASDPSPSCRWSIRTRASARSFSLTRRRVSSSRTSSSPSSRPSPIRP